MKILISAFSCAPQKGSDPGLGWNVAFHVASEHEVWLLLDEHSRSWIEQSRYQGRFPGHLVYLSLPWPFSRLFDVRWRGYLYYALWQIAAFLKARRLHREVRFDLVHHVTYHNSWVPLWMGYLGIPFVWNGGSRESTPWRLYRFLSWRGRLSEFSRAVILQLARRLTDVVTARKAAVILSKSPPGAFPTHRRVEDLACGGLDREEVDTLLEVGHRNGGPFRMLSIGRLVGWKGVSLGIRAFAELLKDLPDAEYWIIGDGPERLYLQRLAAALGCHTQIRFLGWRSRQEVFQRLAEADVLVHLSFHDAFGHVVAEAMAAGRPVVCLDIGGPATLVNRGAGVAIPLRPHEALVGRVAAALCRLARDDAYRRALGEAGRALIQCEYDWSRQARRLMDLYSWLIGGSEDPAKAGCRMHPAPLRPGLD